MIEKQGYWVGGALARGTARTMLGLLAFAALTLAGGAAFAEDENAAPSQSEAANDPAPSSAPSSACSAPDKHPHDDPTVCPVKKVKAQSKTGSSGAQDLAAKAANPSAPVMALKSFLDITTHGGSAPGAHRASFQYEFQPAFPFPTKRGNVIFRPAIPVQFGQPYVTSSGNVETVVAFGNISLDTLYGKTMKNGLMIMGGFSTLFPTNSKPELRADWAIGPEMVLGYASPRTGSIFGTITQFTWSFPTRENGQSVGGQYFYAVNLGKGFQFAAQPIWTYSRESKVLQFPLGVGIQRVMALGKKNQPIQFGVQIWGYAPPPGASGPEWTLRFTVAPIIPLPWKK
jgi:hypothetical protein